MHSPLASGPRVATAAWGSRPGTAKSVRFSGDGDGDGGASASSPLSRPGTAPGRGPATDLVGDDDTLPRVDVDAGGGTRGAPGSAQRPHTASGGLPSLTRRAKKRMKKKKRREAAPKFVKREKTHPTSKELEAAAAAKKAAEEAQRLRDAIPEGW